MSSQIHQSLLLLLLLGVFPILLPLAASQSAPPTPPAPDIAIAPSPALEQCEGIFLQYDYLNGAALYPYRPKNNSDKAYSFRSLLSVLNAGLKTLKSWEVFVGFQHEEILVSMTNAVIADGSELPAVVGNNGTTIAGYPLTDLKTAIATAGDLTQIEARVEIVGTEFGVASPVIPMPANITLVNDGWQCPAVTKLGNRTIFTCCTYNQTVVRNITDTVLFLPRQSGDINIDYDVIQTYTNNYLALVTISNENPLGRLDHWKLSWEWMRGEFIKTMRGAYTILSDASDCLRGPQATQYADVDFTSYMNCQRKPTIVDLPLTRYNDSNVGLIEHCCRNGTILPSGMDPKKAKSAFQLQVFKMLPDLNRTVVYPPQNFKIVGDDLNPQYECGPPVRVAPTVYPDPSGLLSYTDAIASWRVVCNISKPAHPKCCVSFSAYFNDSVVPCRTCACDCPSSKSTCSASATALLLPSEALLVPFVNRTAKALAWAAIKHYNVPNPLPCGDNCGVSINWHVYTDYTNGWSARITLFNWGDVDFADWFVTAELAKALPGFQAAYSFNGTANITGLNDTLFMQGLPGLNYLIAESKDNPGKQQSVISFNKKLTPGINVATGDGFPTKMYFNGQECSMPTAIPTADSPRSITVMSILSSFLLALAVYLFVMDQL